MDKTLAIQKTILVFEQELKRVEGLLLRTQQDARDSPKATESFSDGTRREYQGRSVLLGFEKNRWMKALIFLRKLDSAVEHRKVQLGSLVTIEQSNRMQIADICSCSVLSGGIS